MNSNTTLSIGENLRLLRVTRGYSQQELAEHLEVTQATFSQWEREIKTPTINNIIKVCQFFEISIEQLIYKMPSKVLTY
jgi:transcriptional regulator with XRE-family HTH domain